MELKGFLEKFYVSFLPEKYQKDFKEKRNIKTSRLSLLSSIFTLLLFSTFFISFLGFYYNFKPGFIWLLLLSLFFITFIIDGLYRFIFSLFKKETGSFLFCLFEKLFLKPKNPDDFMDNVIETENSLIVHTPCPKPHWDKWGGIFYNGKNYKLIKKVKIGVSSFYKFEKDNGNYPYFNFEEEKNFNLASDLSLILSPIWGFLSEKYQYFLLKFSRYNLKLSFYFSVFITFFVFFPSLIFDVIRFLQKREVFYFLIPHFLLSLYFVYESMIRFLFFITERKIKGSIISVFIKPLFYMIYRRFF